MDGRMDEWNAECRVVCIIAAWSERKGWDIIGDERESGRWQQREGEKEREGEREGGRIEGCEVASHKSRSRSQPHIGTSL